MGAGLRRIDADSRKIQADLPKISGDLPKHPLEFSNCPVLNILYPMESPQNKLPNFASKFPDKSAENYALYSAEAPIHPNRIIFQSERRCAFQPGAAGKGGHLARKAGTTWWFGNTVGTNLGRNAVGVKTGSRTEWTPFEFTGP